MIEITTPAEARHVIAEITARASSAGIVLREPPEEPDPQTCCGRGCTPCVFSYYYDAVSAWRDAALARLGPARAGA